jgi:uncharacterized damage-inducible protein DinB
MTDVTATAPTIAQTLIAEMEHEMETTRRVLERVPADKTDWKPHDKSMSLGKLALHTATVPGSVAELLKSDSFDAADMKHTDDDNVDAATLTSKLEASVKEAKDTLSGLDDAAMMSPWSFTKDGKELMSLPKVALARSIMLNHWYHHRGQLTVYLRLLDIPVPSIYGPSADENPFE